MSFLLWKTNWQDEICQRFFYSKKFLFLFIYYALISMYIYFHSLLFHILKSRIFQQAVLSQIYIWKIQQSPYINLMINVWMFVKAWEKNLSGNSIYPDLASQPFSCWQREVLRVLIEKKIRLASFWGLNNALPVNNNYLEILSFAQTEATMKSIA